MAAQPERFEDQQEAELLAGVLGHGGDRTVTVSGRCPQCRYLYDSPGHTITCDEAAAAAGIEAVRREGGRAWDIHQARGRLCKHRTPGSPAPTPPGSTTTSSAGKTTSPPTGT